MPHGRYTDDWEFRGTVEGGLRLKESGHQFCIQHPFTNAEINGIIGAGEVQHEFETCGDQKALQFISQFGYDTIFLYLRHMAVDYQNIGIGGRLLEAALAEGQRRGASVALLHARASIGREEDLDRFYRSHGFNPIGLDHTGWLMERAI